MHTAVAVVPSITSTTVLSHIIVGNLVWDKLLKPRNRISIREMRISDHRVAVRSHVMVELSGLHMKVPIRPRSILVVRGAAPGGRCGSLDVIRDLLTLNGRQRPVDGTSAVLPMTWYKNYQI
jgi:hypothetical protein